jgi:release factor glutamine methyltransferase
VRPVEVVVRAADYLERHGVQSPRPTAELLLASTLGVDRAALYMRSDSLTTKEAKLFGRALCRRCTGTPLQHLTGGQGFRRIMLTVRPGVFVPRPETEVVVDSALEILDAIPEGRTPIVVDVCTGCGAIALAMKSERPWTRVIGTDVSTEAVDLARENANRLDLEVDVLEGDLLDPLPPELLGTVDLIVANPPYVLPEDYASLPDDVRADPRPALVGGVDVYRRLFQQAARWLGPGGAVVVEVSETRSGQVVQVANEAGFGAVRVLPDLNGRDRVVTARRP